MTSTARVSTTAACQHCGLVEAPDIERFEMQIRWRRKLKIEIARELRPQLHHHLKPRRDRMIAQATHDAMGACANAREFLDSGDKRSAVMLTELTGALQNPAGSKRSQARTDPQLFLHRALVYAKSGKFEAALEDIKKVLLFDQHYTIALEFQIRVQALIAARDGHKKVRLTPNMLFAS